MTAVSRENDTAAVYTVEKLSDRDTIRGILADEKAYSAYALAQLDSRTFNDTEWVMAPRLLWRAGAPGALHGGPAPRCSRLAIPARWTWR
jgi:hypothetical protein